MQGERSDRDTPGPISLSMNAASDVGSDLVLSRSIVATVASAVASALERSPAGVTVPAAAVYGCCHPSWSSSLVMIGMS